VAPRSEDPKLITRVIRFELVQPVCPRYLNVTDRRTTYDSNTARFALRASCGKNGSIQDPKNDYQKTAKESTRDLKLKLNQPFPVGTVTVES